MINEYYCDRCKVFFFDSRLSEEVVCPVCHCSRKVFESQKLI